MSTPVSPERGRRLPGRWFLVLLTLGALALCWLRFSDAFGDQGMRNAFTMLVVASLGGASLVWFLCARAYALRLRLGVLLGLLALVAVGRACFEFHGFSGSMIPDLRWEPIWGASEAEPASAAAPTPAPERAGIDLGRVGDLDWPGLMGPDRTGTTKRVRLRRDWQAAPPELLWKHALGAGWSSFAVVADVAVTQEQVGQVDAGRQLVRAYDVHSGALLWERSWHASFDHPLGGPGPRSTPQIADGRVVALFPDGRLVCLAGADGAILWERSLTADYGITPEMEAAHMTYGRSNSPLVDDGRVIVPVGEGAQGRGAGLLAVALADGQTAWESPTRVASYSSPVMAQLLGTRQILIVNEASVSAHDPATGALLWEHAWPSRSEADASSSQPVVCGDDRVLVSRGYGAGCALIRVTRGADGAFATEELWQARRSLRTKLTSALAHAGHVFGLSDGILECIDLATGARVWKEGRYGHGQLLIVGDAILLISEEGTLFLIDASPEARGQVLGSLPVLEGKTWNWPALFGDLLLVRNGEEAACLRLPTFASDPPEAPVR